ncbi:hypothetical protein AB0M86_42750 [Streptomyces sp. NPDC051639]|uniref:hypothetical protein n=1 Tax=unclassified Streptomyces TaxID=2593676 RepID=UPI00143E78F5|nr:MULTISPECIES: hypothetical protein [unclassified Streptomyces]QIY66292.1 hypothetical protein HEP85_38025 [Streptomyces sp. RPA4-2]
MPRWVILRSNGESEAFRYNAPYRELEGTEAEALSAMLRIVDTYAQARSESGRRRQRRQVTRVTDRSYILEVHNRMSSEHAQFTLAEVIADTHDDSLPDTVSGEVAPL